MDPISKLPPLQYIEGLVRILRESGVSSFSCGDFVLDFGEYEATIGSDDDDLDAAPDAPEPTTPKPPRAILEDVFEQQIAETSTDFRKNPLLWGGADRVPHFPEKGSMKPTDSSEE